MFCPDATPGTEEFDLFIKDVAKEMTIKAGQKCTAIRRTIVPTNLMSDVISSLKKRLSKVVIGDPQTDGVRMGSLAGMDQLRDVKEKIMELSSCCNLEMGGDEFEVTGASKSKGAFMMPTLFSCEKGLATDLPHEGEARQAR